jgi:Lar family restriction alleviation protein
MTDFLNEQQIKKAKYDLVYCIRFKNEKIVKACPFCGRKPWMGGVHNYAGIKWTIRCKKCGYSFWYGSEKAVVQFWNKRHIASWS